MEALRNLPLSEGIISTFNELIKKDRLPHAILLDGSDRDARDSVSKYIAASLVCSAEEKPCFKCTNCFKVDADAHPDVTVFDPEQTNEKTFKIALVREIRTDAFILPNEAAKKVYILKSADKMNIQAQNALLKIIEEPPSYARFILECDSRAAMLETIMSRVSAFNLGSGKQKLNDEQLSYANELAIKLADALLKPTELEFMRISSVIESKKELFEPLLSALQLIFRDAVAIKIGSDVLLAGQRDISSALASRISVSGLTLLVSDCEHFYDCINKNANKNLMITRFCSVIRSSAYSF